MAGNSDRIVITGVGVAAPNGSTLKEFRRNLLAGVSGVRAFDLKYLGTAPAGVCEFDEFKYQTKKARRRGTRAGSISIYCSGEALSDAGINLEEVDRSRIGVFIGMTEHGSVETEHELWHLLKEYNEDIKFWSHHLNPRTIANNPAGEVTLSLKITGPHYTIGGACAGGNLGIIQGVQMLRLGEVDIALAGGESECIHAFGVFASFKNEGALAQHEDPTKACRPFDKKRNGVVISEGGAVLVLERLDRARKRSAKIYGEIVAYHTNSDALDYVAPSEERQAECMAQAIRKAGIEPADIDLIGTHATGTPIGDPEECRAIRTVFGEKPRTYMNNAKSLIGHTMGAAGAVELVANLSSFEDNLVHPTINIDELDPACDNLNLVIDKPVTAERMNYFINNAFGMLGTNSAVIVKRYMP